LLVCAETELDLDSEDEFEYAPVAVGPTARAFALDDPDPGRLLSSLIDDSQRRRVEDVASAPAGGADSDRFPTDREILAQLLALLELPATSLTLAEEWAAAESSDDSRETTDSFGRRLVQRLATAASAGDAPAKMGGTTSANTAAATPAGEQASAAAAADDVSSSLHHLETQLARMTKERDFHRMHHKRMNQEKARLASELTKAAEERDELRERLDAVERQAQRTRKKQMLAGFENERLRTQLDETQTARTDTMLGDTGASTLSDATMTNGSSSRLGRDSKSNTSSNNGLGATASRHYESTFPPARLRKKSPAATASADVSGDTTPTLSPQSLSVFATVEAHERGAAVTGVVCHPTKPNIAVTVSEDNTWKMWAFGDDGNGETSCILTGEGHEDWVSDAAFRPDGSRLATASGDGTVKIWDLATQECVATFRDHKKSVWSCDMHWGGDFLLTGSLDHTARVFDLNAGPSKRCRTVLRGHTDSVNYACVQPGTNHAATASGDKTVCMWDMRTGHAIQTFTGHRAAVEHVCFAPGGEMLASTDSDGSVRLWDVRMVAQRGTYTTSTAGANRAAFHPKGRYLIVPTDESPIVVIDTTLDSQHNSTVARLSGPTAGTTQVAFVDDNTLRSSSADGTLLTWKM
jgi:sperm-associated antigen 16 protein